MVRLRLAGGLLDLQSYGLAGIVIFALGTIVYLMHKNSVEVNNSRLNERDILIKTIENNTNAARENTKATDERNSVTRALAESINKQASTFEMFTQKTELQNEAIRDKIQDQKLVIDSLAESNRTNTGILRDVQRAVVK